MNTQLQDALQVRAFRDDAIRLRSETLRILYETTLADYKEKYNEEPWLIIAKEGKNDTRAKS